MRYRGASKRNRPITTGRVWPMLVRLYPGTTLLSRIQAVREMEGCSLRAAIALLARYHKRRLDAVRRRS